MSFADLQAAVGVSIAARVPLILWGPPGQGKTKTLEAIAESNGMMIRTVLASIREPSDFAGLPYIVDGRTTRIPPDWAQEIADHTTGGGSAMLFFDEVSTTPPASQAALLRVTLERMAGSLYLGDKVAIVAAANPPEIAADGWDLAAPMANRFCHLDWSLPADTVRDGFTVGWPEVRVPVLDPDAVAPAVASAKTLVAAFLTHRPDMVTVMPASSAEAGRAYPTPRSWDMAAVLYGYATAANASAVSRRMLIVGTVGQAAAAEFLSYVAELDLPDPEFVLAHANDFEVPARGDRVYAVGVSVLAALSTNMTPERWRATGDVVARIANAKHADVAVQIGKRWIGLREDMSIMPNPESLKALAPILKEAKILAGR